ncbi:hypothetical protein BaRGS_00009466, partial [Batillaria attramentaria]
PPSTANGALTLTQNRMAVTDEKGELHVRLTCSFVTDLGQPPVEVFWKENTNQANQLSQYHLENVNLTNYVHNLEAELTHFHAPPSTAYDALALTQNRVAVSDDKGELHVRLTCGTFTDLGQPPVEVVWKENINQANQLSQYHLENVNLTNYVHNLQSELTLFH